MTNLEKFCDELCVEKLCTLYQYACEYVDPEICPAYSFCVEIDGCEEAFVAWANAGKEQQ